MNKRAVFHYTRGKCSRGRFSLDALDSLIQGDSWAILVVLQVGLVDLDFARLIDLQFGYVDLDLRCSTIPAYPVHSESATVAAL